MRKHCKTDLYSCSASWHESWVNSVIYLLSYSESWYRDRFFSFYICHFYSLSWSLGGAKSV